MNIELIHWEKEMEAELSELSKVVATKYLLSFMNLCVVKWAHNKNVLVLP